MIPIVSYVNSGHILLGVNWLLSLHKLSLDSGAILYCIDRLAYETMCAFQKFINSDCQIRSFFQLEVGNQETPNSNEILTRTADWGTKNFCLVMLKKLAIQEELWYEMGSFIYVDIDCSFSNNVGSYFDSNCTQSDVYLQSNRNDYLRPSAKNSEFCAGIIYYRKPRIDIIQRTITWLSERISNIQYPLFNGGKFLDDELAINKVCHELGYEPGHLPIELFPTGRYPWNKKSIIVHANWCIGVENKIKKLKAEGHFHVEDFHAHFIELTMAYHSAIHKISFL